MALFVMHSMVLNYVWLGKTNLRKCKVGFFFSLHRSRKGVVAVFINANVLKVTNLEISFSTVKNMHFVKRSTKVIDSILRQEDCKKNIYIPILRNWRTVV